MTGWCSQITRSFQESGLVRWQQRNSARGVGINQTIASKPALLHPGARPPRALLAAPSRPALWAPGPCAGQESFSAHEVFREGAENSARGGRAPHATSDFGLQSMAVGQWRAAQNQKSEKQSVQEGYKPMLEGV